MQLSNHCRLGLHPCIYPAYCPGETPVVYPNVTLKVKFSHCVAALGSDISLACEWCITANPVGQSTFD